MFPTLSPQIDHRTSSSIAKGPPLKTTADNRSRVPAIHVLPSTKLIKNKEEKSFHSINRYFHATHAIPLRKSRDEKNKSLLKLFNRWKNLPEKKEKNLKTSRKNVERKQSKKAPDAGSTRRSHSESSFFFRVSFFEGDRRPSARYFFMLNRTGAGVFRWRSARTRWLWNRHHQQLRLRKQFYVMNHHHQPKSRWSLSPGLIDPHLDFSEGLRVGVTAGTP